MNTMTLFPYKKVYGGNLGSCWVFDDPATQLKSEAFVCGISEMIDRIVAYKKIPNAENGFALTFGFTTFDGADAELHWLKEGSITFKPEDEEEKVTILLGNWYGGDVAGKTMVGWLCPALGKYFIQAPKVLFVGVSPLPEGVDPIWHNAPAKEWETVVNEGDKPTTNHNMNDLTEKDITPIYWWEDKPEGYDFQN